MFINGGVRGPRAIFCLVQCLTGGTYKPIRSVGVGNASSLVSGHEDVTHGTRNSMLWSHLKIGCRKNKTHWDH